MEAIIISELESKPGYKEYTKNIDRLHRLYEMREDAIREYISAFNEAKREGARNQAIEIAKNMLADNIDIDIIIKCTDLSQQEIEQIKLTIPCR